MSTSWMFRWNNVPHRWTFRSKLFSHDFGLPPLPHTHIPSLDFASFPSGWLSLFHSLLTLSNVFSPFPFRCHHPLSNFIREGNPCEVLLLPAISVLKINIVKISHCDTGSGWPVVLVVVVIIGGTRTICLGGNTTCFRNNVGPTGRMTKEKKMGNVEDEGWQKINQMLFRLPSLP